MSAAATAAGYLYASGRLRSRGNREESEPGAEKIPAAPARKTVRIAVVEAQDWQDPQQRAEKPKRTPKIEYRTRRWKPNEQG